MNELYEVSYVGDGTTTDFVVNLDYIRKAYILVQVDGSPTFDYSWFNDQTIRFNIAPDMGADIYIVNRPPGDTPINTFTSTVITPTALNENFRQAAQLGSLFKDDAEAAMVSAADAQQRATDAELEAAQALVVAQAAFDRANDAATGAIADGSVTTVKLADDAVTATKLADDAVETRHIQDSAVTISKINNLAVTTDKLANGAVTEDKLEGNSVTNSKILNGQVLESKLANNAVSTAKIADSAVTADKLASDAVTTTKILNAAITGDKLNSDAVSTAKIAALAVTTAKIADAAITTNKLGSDLNLPGAPTTDTPPGGDDSTRIATTAWVRGFGVPSSRRVDAGRGLSGGGNLANDRELSIPTGFIESGSGWSPTITNTSNCTSVSFTQGSWLRVDNVVTLTGRLSLDITSLAIFSFEITLPLNVGGFAAVNQALGNFSTRQGNNPGGGEVTAVNGANRLSFTGTAPATGTRSLFFTAQYRIS
jgi:hypothetical protein